jgi:hypothetical protein
MPPRSAPLWACLLVLGWPALASAEGPPTIDKQVPIRVGLPSGTQGVGRMRQGAWAPVYVSLTAHKEGNGQQQFKLVFDALDLEENPYTYTAPVPALGPDVPAVVVGYLRAPSQDFTVTLKTIDGKTIHGPVKYQRTPEADPLKPVYPLYVVAGGSNLSELKEAMKPDPRPGEPPDSTSIDKYYARISKVHDMPDRWFGYDAADVVILTTDKDDFMKELNDSRSASRRKALAEWVRRGGKLVISVGRNHQLVNSLLASMPLPEVDKMPLVPFEITGSVQRKTLPIVGSWAIPPAPPLGEGKAGVEVATLALGAERPKERGLGGGTHVLLVEDKTADGKDPEQRPIIVSSSCGLGRVILVAFDLDGPPFTDWGDPKNSYQKAFFVHLRDEVTPKLFDPERLRAEVNFTGRDRPELLEALQRQTDSFEDVPVISFGWVALFIFVYIIIVGPLDYFVLKKVFKRLELTWVTFPTVVLTISVGAYFIAYALKGDDLRVNKIDVVEIDLHTPQAYGTSWFSVFSPRVQNYTLAVEPTFGGKPSSEVSLMENPLATPRGSTSIFRQPYEYAEDAAGIENVPIPVWSTRSFAASWRAPLAADKLPVKAELVWPEAGGGVTGKITNNLPVDLEDVTLFYRGKWYRLSKDLKEGRLVRDGGFFDVTNLKMGDPGAPGQQPLDSWFKDPTVLATSRPASGPSRRTAWQGGPQPGVPSWTDEKKEMLFYQERLNALNSGLRTLNQAWRLEQRPTEYKEERGLPYREEVILVARAAAAPPNTPGHEVNDKGLVRLWNDKLPGAADKCPPLSGFLSQETYVRVYIPVKNP